MPQQTTNHQLCQNTKKTDQQLKSMRSQEDCENQLAVVEQKSKIIQKVPEK